MNVWKTGACCAAVVPLCVGILGILSRKEVLPPLLQGSRPGFLLRVSAFLYRNVWEGRTHNSRKNIRADLAVLYPSRRADGREEAYEIKKICNMLRILFIGSLLAGAAVLRGFTAGPWRTEDGKMRVERDVYGGVEREERLIARVGETEAVEVPVTVSARRYTPGQLDALAEELFALLPERIRGENTGLDKVTHDLDLTNRVEGYPFTIRWETGEPGILSDEGQITDSGERREGTEVFLTAFLTAETDRGVRSYEKTYVLKVFSPEKAEQLLLQRRLEQQVSRRDTESIAQPYLELPDRTEDTGQAILWSKAGDGSVFFLLLISAAAALLYAPLSDRRLHTETVRRERQLREDYPVLVSRLALYLGAGMSLRNIFIRIAEDYRNERLRGKKERCLCEEILLLVREMESGIPEAEAYTHFGARCRCSVYARLTSLLTQNLRKGNRALLSVLHREAQEAFRERRITARIRGEEAETRLLFPMVMMLAVTMLIIMIPAYLSFAV